MDTDTGRPWGSFSKKEAATAAAEPRLLTPLILNLLVELAPSSLLWTINKPAFSKVEMQGGGGPKGIVLQKGVRRKKKGKSERVGGREVSLCANLFLSSFMISIFPGFSVDIRQVRPVSQVGRQRPAQLLSISAESESGFVGIMTEGPYQPFNNWPTFTRPHGCSTLSYSRMPCLRATFNT